MEPEEGRSVTVRATVPEHAWHRAWSRVHSQCAVVNAILIFMMSLVLREFPVQDDTVVDSKERGAIVKQSALDQEL